MHTVGGHIHRQLKNTNAHEYDEINEQKKNEQGEQ